MPHADFRLDARAGFCHLRRTSRAGVVKLVDAPDSKSGSARSVGSIPTTRTTGIPDIVVSIIAVPLSRTACGHAMPIP